MESIAKIKVVSILFTFFGEIRSRKRERCEQSPFVTVTHCEKEGEEENPTMALLPLMAPPPTPPPPPSPDITSQTNPHPIRPHPHFVAGVGCGGVVLRKATKRANKKVRIQLYLPHRYEMIKEFFFRKVISDTIRKFSAPSDASKLGRIKARILLFLPPHTPFPPSSLIKRIYSPGEGGWKGEYARGNVRRRHLHFTLYCLRERERENASVKIASIPPLLLLLRSNLMLLQRRRGGGGRAGDTT